MAIRSGRVGVRSNQVDVYGRIKGLEKETLTDTLTNLEKTNTVCLSPKMVEGHAYASYNDELIVVDDVIDWLRNGKVILVKAEVLSQDKLVALTTSFIVGVIKISDDFVITMLTAETASGGSGFETVIKTLTVNSDGYISLD